MSNHNEGSGELSTYSLYSDCCDSKITTLINLLSEPILKQIIDDPHGKTMVALQEAISELFGHLEAHDSEVRWTLHAKAKEVSYGVESTG